MKSIKKKYQILTFQTCSLYDSGGTSRILRRLFEGRENDIFSIGISIFPLKKNTRNLIAEQIIPLYPYQKKWMRWIIRKFIIYLRLNLMVFLTRYLIKINILRVDHEILHLVDQGIFFPIEFLKKNYHTKFWVSFHDHFTALDSKSKRTEYLWNYSNRRFVISEAMGLEYSRLFGNQKYEIITDGLYGTEVSKSRSIIQGKEIIVYFAGLLHVDYYDLFKVLSNTLEVLSNEYNFKLVLRGTQKVNFLDNRKFKVEYLGVTFDNSLLKIELDEADIMYLPIKFTVPEFSLYSLSTKMVGYLGGSGTILYHGPKESAAYELLYKYNASINCVSLDQNDMIFAIKEILNNGNSISHNAKILANENFNMDKIKNSFWLNL